MNVRGADFLVSYVDNLEMAVEFYQDTLGLRLNLYKPDWNWAEFDIPPTTLVLFGIYDGAPLPAAKVEARSLSPWMTSSMHSPS